MKIHLDYVSVSVTGEYYQVMFEDKEEDEGDAILDTPYVLIQRQFEMPDGGRIYIETHDESFIGPFTRIPLTSGVSKVPKSGEWLLENRRISLMKVLRSGEEKSQETGHPCLFFRSEPNPRAENRNSISSMTSSAIAWYSSSCLSR
ncbi:MAG: hypothetical protein DRR42_18465 [Gammaproteobacteria bacterium]|nr:MAG: hypothetical protein DRR42_18465 [Gammaproteobacteria bacterium]